MIRAVSTFISLTCFAFGFSQEDCYLGIGGKDEEIIEKVFQLDSTQVEQMRNWGAELKYRNSFLIGKANNLVKRHTESSPKVLMAMSVEYKKILDSMQGNLRMLDRRMLGIFNEEQYNLYVMLCNQISNSPLHPTVSFNEKE